MTLSNLYNPTFKLSYIARLLEANMKIYPRLILAIFVYLVLFYSLWLYSDYNKRVTKLYEAQLKSISNINNMKRTLDCVNDMVYHYIVTGNDQYVKFFETGEFDPILTNGYCTETKISKYMSDMVVDLEIGSDQLPIDKIQAEFDSYIDAQRQISRLVSHDTTHALNSLYDKTFLMKRDHINAWLISIQNNITQYSQYSILLTKQYIKIYLLICLVSFLAVVGITTYLFIGIRFVLKTPLTVAPKEVKINISKLSKKDCSGCMSNSSVLLSNCADCLTKQK